VVGLLHVADHACGQGILCMAVESVPRRENGPDARIDGLEGLEAFLAVCSWHHHIDDDQVYLVG